MHNPNGTLQGSFKKETFSFLLTPQSPSAFTFGHFMDKQSMSKHAL